MDTQFKIEIQDDEYLAPEFALEQNKKSVDLHDWQRRAKEFFNSHHKVLYEVATGAGKTYFAIDIIKDLLIEYPNIRVLIVVPKNVILERTWYKELYDAGFSIKDIGIYYGNIKEQSQFTLTNMQNLAKLGVEYYDLVVYDEIHNYGTKKLLKFLQHENKYKIGLSATMERMDNKHYDIWKAFDYNIFKYTPKDALNEGILNPFNFINIGVIMDPVSFQKYDEITQELNSILQAGGGFIKIMKTNTPLKNAMLSILNQRKDLVSNYFRKFDVVNEIIQSHRNDKVLIFNQYNKQTNKLYWYMLDVGIRARIIHSGIGTDDRNKILDDFKNEKFNVLLTSKVLDEGYNLPKIDTAIIMAGDSNERQTIQRMGRVLRKKQKDSTLYQIYCKNTVEEKYAIKRASLFKMLCTDFRESDF